MKRIAGIICVIGMLLLTGCRDGVRFYDAGQGAEPEQPADAGQMEPEHPEPEQTESGQKEDIPLEAEKIWVDVCGEVQKPGVYCLEPGSRVFEAVSAAGGLTDAAEARSLNQAELLQDGQKIVVLNREEAKARREAKQSGQDSDNGENTGLVNLNTASKSELMSLPGIGEVKAQAIITYRESHGKFNSIEEIKQIDGIKDSVFEKIRDKIRVQ